MDPSSVDITQVGVVGGILVIANQALRIVAQVLRERYQEKRGEGSPVREASPHGDPETVARIKRIDESVVTMMTGINQGVFSCRWKNESVVNDHIRDAKETLKKVEELHE